MHHVAKDEKRITKARRAYEVSPYIGKPEVAFLQVERRPLKKINAKFNFASLGTSWFVTLDPLNCLLC